MNVYRITAMAKQLTDAGYVIERCEGRWAIVTGGPFYQGRTTVYYQGPGRWHWFWHDHMATESSYGAGDRRGCLGDVLDTDSQCRSYERGVRKAPSWTTTWVAG